MKSQAKYLVLGIFLGLLVLPGCARVDYVADADERVKAGDWDRMETVTVVLGEYFYKPSELHFRAGVPYKLEIQNQGTMKHYFTAPEFYRAIATRKVQSNADGEIKAPYFLALEVFPGRSLDLYFIPVTKGTYKLHCTVPGHEAQGMHGMIVVE